MVARAIRWPRAPSLSIASKTSVISLTAYDGSPVRPSARPLSHPASEPIPAQMDDSFSLGERAKRRVRPVRPKHAAPRSRTSAAGGSFERTLYILGGIGIIVAVLLVWGFMHFMAGAGNEASNGQASEIGAGEDGQGPMTGQEKNQSVGRGYAG